MPSFLKAIRVYSRDKGVEQDGSSRNLCFRGLAALAFMGDLTRKDPGLSRLKPKSSLNPLFCCSLQSLVFVWGLWGFWGYNRHFSNFLDNFYYPFSDLRSRIARGSKDGLFFFPLRISVSAVPIFQR